MAGFKAATTSRINAHDHQPGRPVWQRGYHESIVRDEEAVARIRRYIQQNPASWSARRGGR